jgi:predicted ribosome quality control (RQC) complex YloA/Tae2 family protein
MKEGMSSIDVSAAVSELKSLIGARVDKVYQHTYDEIRLQLYTRASGRSDLIIEAGKRFHLTNYPRISPKTPSSFAMLLRKHISSGKITEVKQHNFDRVIEIAIERGEKKNYLVIELFSKGNIILLDENRKIILPLHSLSFQNREVKQGREYEYPPSKLNPIELRKSDLEELLKQSERDLVRTLATQLNLGGLYAEEICLRANLNKAKLAKTIEGNELEKLLNAIQEIFTPLLKGEFKPHIVIKEGMEIDVLPLELLQYSEYEKKYHPTFNAALDEYFTKLVLKKMEADVEKASGEKLLILRRMLNQQQEAINKLLEEEKQYIEKGELIYSNYKAIESLLAKIKEAKKKKISWEEIKRGFKQIKCINEATGEVIVELEDREIELNINYSLPQNAAKYYEQAKKIKEKREGAESALAETKKKIAEEEKRQSKVTLEPLLAPRRRIKKKKHWYDEFRWFISSDGYLIVGGRDAETNEELVKKYMQNEDLFFHAQAHGAPAVIVKTEGREVPESTLREAAQFSVSYSNVWKAKQFTGDCYWVKPEQVTKRPESGEYITKGAFVIRGERNYFYDIPLGIAIGVEIDEETRVIAGPVSAVKAKSKYYVELLPGDMDQNEAAKKIAIALLEIASKEDEHIVKAIANPSEIIRFLPPGEIDIAKVERSNAL